MILIFVGAYVGGILLLVAVVLAAWVYEVRRRRRRFGSRPEVTLSQVPVVVQITRQPQRSNNP